MGITTFKPATPGQLADAVRWALDAGEPLELAGTGSKRALGRPVQAGHALDLSDLSGVVSYEPEELVLTVRAATRMAEIEAMLRGRGQHLAFEPPDLGPLYGQPLGGGTLGGVLAAGLAGPRRLSSGSARDHFLGVAGVSGRGEAYKGGAKVVKNVTGYDVPKLMAGSFGTLTAMTEVTVKVLPAPEDTRTLLLQDRSDAEGIRALTAALHSPHEVSGAAHLPESVAERIAPVASARASVTAIRLEGFGPSVAARLAGLTADLSVHFGGIDGVLDRDESLAFWRAVRDAAPFQASSPDSDPLVWKLSVPPASGPRAAEELVLALGDVEFFFDWGGGLIWLATPRDTDAAALRAALAPFGGHATLVRGPDPLRAAVDVFQPQPAPLLALTQRVKASFDPRGVLNPGRLFAGV